MGLDNQVLDNQIVDSQVLVNQKLGDLWSSFGMSEVYDKK